MPLTIPTAHIITGSRSFRAGFRILALAGATVLLTCLASCSSREPVMEQTLLMYFPYAGNLQPWFRTNISDMESAVVSRGGLGQSQLLIYLASSETEGSLYRMTCSRGKCEEQLLEQYTCADHTSATFMAGVLGKVKQAAPAEEYDLIIGGHGLGWVLSDDFAAASGQLQARRNGPAAVSDEQSLTRFFGGKEEGTRCEVSALAEAMRQAGFETRYLLFDACFMAGVEVAYTLRQQTHYLIASGCEVMNYGMPYALVGEALLGQPDYRTLTEKYLAFYQDYEPHPCGTLAVIDCSRMDALAALTARLTAAHGAPQAADPAPGTTADSACLQALDAYTPTIFYDYADWMRSFPLTEAESMSLDSLLRLAVPYAVRTETFYSSLTKEQYAIRRYSGLSTSAPSRSPYARSYAATSWAQAAICQSGDSADQAPCCHS